MSEARKTVVDGRYDVVRPLGSGGMGEVYLAHDEVLGRDVALKVLRRQFAGDGEFAERFRREARSAASLSHPNIVQVYDRGETEEGASYIAMEYVPGGTLKERISREGTLEASVAAALGAQVAGALEAAHERGMVHRDVKPQNVLLTAGGDAKVADFGIARAGSSVTISKTGSVMGTAGYMSPEQALGEPATPRSDLYSLGIVFYEAITGELPYKADNPIAVSMKHVTEQPRPPREIDPAIPESMNDLILKLMAKDPEARYASAGQLADDLRRIGRGLSPAAVGAPGAPRTRRTVVARNPTNKAAPVRRPTPARRRRGLPWFPLAVAAILFLLGTLGILQALGPDATNGWLDGIRANGNPPDRPSASAEVRVPDVAGLPRSKAQQRLSEAGLEVGRITRLPSEGVAFGRVIAAGYPAGTKVDRGTEVNLDVSSGPPPPASSASPSARSSASARPSPGPAASSASPSASAVPDRQEDRPAVESPPAGERAPGADATETRVRQRPSARNPNASPGVAVDDRATRGAGSEDERGGNSGPGANSGRGGESGEG